MKNTAKTRDYSTIKKTYNKYKRTNGIPYQDIPRGKNYERKASSTSLACSATWRLCSPVAGAAEASRPT